MRRWLLGCWITTQSPLDIMPSLPSSSPSLEGDLQYRLQCYNSTCLLSFVVKTLVLIALRGEAGIHAAMGSNS